MKTSHPDGVNDELGRVVQVPVLYSLEELFLLSQSLNEGLKENEAPEEEEEEEEKEDENEDEEPPKKKLKPSRSLRKRSEKTVKQEAQEFPHEEESFRDEVLENVKNIEMNGRILPDALSQGNIKELVKELKNKDALIDELQQQFVTVQSENLYKDSELRDLRMKVSTHLETSAELLKTINSLKIKVDQVTDSESNQVKCLELKISKLEAENKSIRNNPSVHHGDHTNCEKKKKDLLLERLKIFQKFSDEEKLTARLRTENVELKNNQEKLDKALKTFENKIKEFTEDKKKLKEAMLQIKTLETEKQGFLAEARKEEDLMKRVESLEAKVKKYKILLKKSSENSQKETQSKIASPINLSSFEEAWRKTEVDSVIEDKADSEERTESEGGLELEVAASLKSFDARMFQSVVTANNNERSVEEGKIHEDIGQVQETEIVVSVDIEKETLEESFEDLTATTSTNSLSIVSEPTSVVSEEERQTEESEEGMKKCDSLDEPNFSELVIDWKDEADDNSQDNSSEDLVIDLKERSPVSNLEGDSFVDIVEET